MDEPPCASPRIALTSADRDRLALLVRIRREAGETDELIELLDQEISRADIVPAHEAPPDLAVLGAEVRYLDHESGAEQEARLVWPGAGSDDPDALSVLTPIGCALIGLSCGQTIRWRLQSGARVHVTLLKVLSRPRPRFWLSGGPPRRRRFRLFRLL